MPIYYQRKDQEGLKQSDVTLFKSDPGSSLKEALTKALGILIVVNKKREIYFIDNVKFHLDTVEGLGTFVEIEAIDFNGTIGKEELSEQCRFFLDLFKILGEDLVSLSYSDLLLQRTQ
jgi:adenylate cyclase class 2